jgi:hypothetical protein
MKKFIASLLVVIVTTAALAQSKKNVSISFKNNYDDVYHLSLIIYTPDGKNEIRVSNVQPGQVKQYSYPEGSEIFIADWKQEAYAMQGNDIKATGIKPFIVLTETDNKKEILLKNVSVLRNVKTTITKPNADSALGTWVIDLQPTPASEAYLKDFKFTKIDSTRFDGEFYGYPFSGGFLNTSWDKIYFAFTTQDQSSTYYHAGYIEGNNVYGITLNEQREFVLPWRGKRK